MSGWASALGEIGNTLENRNQTLLQQRFAHNENALRMTQERAKYLAEHLQKLRSEFPDDPEIADLLTDAELMAVSGRADEKEIERLGQMTIKAQQAVRARRAEERAVQSARAKNTPAVNSALDQYNSGSVQPPASPSGGGGGPAIAPVPPPYAPQAPLAGMIGGGGLAQPATSPVQGGGSSPNATFRPATPRGAGAGAGAPSAPPLVPPVAQPTGLADGPEPRGTSAALGPDAAVPPPLMDLDAAPPLLQLSAGTSSTAPVNPYLSQQVERDYEMYQVTGRMTPLLKKTFELQAQTDQTVDLEGRKSNLKRSEGQQRAARFQELIQGVPIDPLLGGVLGMEAEFGNEFQAPSLPTPPPRYIEVGDYLYDTTNGERIKVGDSLASPTGSPFNVTRAIKEAELGRPLTSKELVALDRELAGGEPLYPVVGPGGAVYVPRSQAAGRSAPRTVYNAEGIPTTGGMEGVSTTPPPLLPVGTQDDLTGMKNSLTQFRNVEKLLADPKYSNIGPISGRLTLAEVNKLGGVGATPEQILLAVTLQRLVASQAFAEGGKALTPTELAQFTLTTPAMTDLIPTAIIKAKAAIQYLNERYQNRISMIPERQRNQVDLSLPPSGSAPLVRTQAEFDALPSGAEYMEEDGKKYRKP